MPDKDIEQYFESLTRFGIKPGLERMRFLLDRCDHPESRYPAVLVGGTNGKGSVVEYLATILASAGYTTGAYTSPHIHRYHERIRINGREIPDEVLVKLLHQVVPHVDASRSNSGLGEVTEFEILTLLAFLYFAQRRVDIAIVEVGLGGRWDATNACDPVVSLITHIALDHTDRLGGDVVSIAREKIPIIRPHRVLVTGEQKPEALDIFRSACDQQDTALLGLGQDFDCDLLEDTPRGIRLRIRTPERQYEAIESSLVGRCQAENVSLAVVAAEEIGRASGTCAGTFHINADAIQRGIASTRLPGRFEILRTDPTVILDGSNNPDGAARLAESLTRYFGDRRIILVVGISDDKDVESMVAALAPVAAQVIATRADHPRATPTDRIVAAARLWKTEVRAVVPVAEAVRAAIARAAADDIVCIAGSFFVLGEVEV